MIREKWYEWKNWREMIHTTWNPRNPGVIRIHMIPPKFQLFRFLPSAAILNGNQIVPVSESWAILLTEFIKQLNRYGDGEMAEEELEKVIQNTCREVSRVFPYTDEALFRADLAVIAEAFEDIAKGKKPETDIGQMDIGSYAPYMTAPHRMDLMVSAMEKKGRWNCNQHCIHCYAAGQRHAGSRELSTPAWKQIIEKCRKARIPQLTFTGGEPTLREDLPELIYSARWFVTRLNTNGVRLTKEYCQRLRKAELDNVQITLYSADREVHNKLTGASYFDETVAGIEHALEAGLSVNINTPLCRVNAAYMETVKFLKNLGVVYVTCSGMIPAGNAAAPEAEALRLSEGEITEAVSQALEYCGENAMEIQFTSPGWISEENLLQMGLEIPSCGAALSNMAITPSGDVVACQSCLDRESFGNMRDTKWERIWNHPSCKAYREYSRKMEQRCPLGSRKDEYKERDNEKI